MSSASSQTPNEKLQVYLRPDLVSRLHRTKGETRISISELVGTAVEEFFARRDRKGQRQSRQAEAVA